MYKIMYSIRLYNNSKKDYMHYAKMYKTNIFKTINHFIFINSAFELVNYWVSVTR